MVTNRYTLQCKTLNSSSEAYTDDDGHVSVMKKGKKSFPE